MNFYKLNSRQRRSTRLRRHNRYIRFKASYYDYIAKQFGPFSYLSQDTLLATVYQLRTGYPPTY